MSARHLLPRRLPALSRPQIRTLTTTTPLLGSPPSQVKQPAALRKTANRGAAETVRKSPFSIGERKAIRNRIILSNTNAPDLNLPSLTPDVLTDAENIGKVYQFSDSQVDRLRLLEAFNRNQDWKYFAKPASVVTKASLEMGERMEGAVREKRTVGGVVDGFRGSGKGVLMAQTMASAMDQGWLVMSIPNALDLTLGHTDYEPSESTSLYLQRTYTASLLSRTLSANTPLLDSLLTTTSYSLSAKATFDSSTPWSALFKAAARDPNVSTETLSHFLSFLSTSPSAPPVLFTCDNFNQLTLPVTGYRSAEFSILHPLDLQLPNLFYGYLRGERKFANGGIAMAVLSRNAPPKSQALEAWVSGEELPAWGKVDRRVGEALEGAERWEVGTMGEAEAKGLVEYCVNSGLKGTEGLGVAERVVLASGVARDLVRGCVRVRA